MPFWPFDLTAGGWPSPGSSPILAYLDPGMGSYAFQILLATLFGGTFALKQSWSEVKGWFASRLGIRSGRFDLPADSRSNGGRPLPIKRPRIDGQSPARVR